MTTAALRAHYLRVADESPVPVLLYNIPKYMHFALAAALVAELAKHENIIGIKDSSGNRELFAGYMESQSPTFAVLTGNAQMFQHAMATGATRRHSRGGAVRAGARARHLRRRCARGDDAAAMAAQARFTPLGAKIVGELGVAGREGGDGSRRSRRRSGAVAAAAARRARSATVVTSVLESAELAAA